jgi:acyl phosphate:glycerol-3-phosphate acyltransferase
VWLPAQHLESRGGNQFRGIISSHCGGDCSRQSLILDLESEMLWTDATTGALASWGFDALIILASYLLGCLTAGYYLVRWRSGKDIRKQGSGSAGATNAGRALGPAGFAGTFLLDLAKGALAAWLAAHLGLGPGARLLCSLAVVAGHIWPAQLRFRGGKGAAPLVGALLVADYRIVLIMAVTCASALALLRRFSLSGLIALATAPLILLFALPPPERALRLFLLVTPVLYAHRQNIREDLGMRPVGKMEG